MEGNGNGMRRMRISALGDFPPQGRIYTGFSDLSRDLYFTDHVRISWFASQVKFSKRTPDPEMAFCFEFRDHTFQLLS